MITNPRVLARLLLAAEESVRSLSAPWKKIHQAADRHTPRARTVTNRAFKAAKRGVSRELLVLALDKRNDARVLAIMDRAMAHFGEIYRAPMTRVLANTMTAAGQVAAKDLKEKLTSLRAAAFNPDQPRDDDGKFAPVDGGGSPDSEVSFGRNSEAIDMMAPINQNKIKADRLSTGYAHLYHVTDIDAARSINREGFDSKAENQFQGFKSEHAGAYGWSSKERARLEIQRMVNSPGGGDPSDWAIVELQVPESEWSRMKPDEDFGGTWQDSYKDGSAAVTGDVPKEWIVGNYVDESVDLKTNSSPSTRIALDVQRGVSDTSVLRGAARDASLRVAAPKIKGFAFDRTNPRAKEWVEDHVGELITDISRTTRERVRGLVDEAFDGEFDTHELADRIADLIGDESRAESIARTETMAASNGGQREAWSQAVDEGLLNGDEEEEWLTTPDDITCPVCRPLDGVRKPLNGMFNVDGEEMEGPPAHPRCRCTTALALKT